MEQGGRDPPTSPLRSPGTAVQGTSTEPGESCRRRGSRTSDILHFWAEMDAVLPCAARPPPDAAADARGLSEEAPATSSSWLPPLVPSSRAKPLRSSERRSLRSMRRALEVPASSSSALPPLAPPPRGKPLRSSDRRSLRFMRREPTTAGPVRVFPDVAINADANMPFSARGQAVLSARRISRSSAGSLDSSEFTAAEVARKRTEAADWFEQACNINASHGQTLDENLETFRIRLAASKEAASLDGSQRTPRGLKPGTPRLDAFSTSSTTAAMNSTPSASSGSANAAAAATKLAEGQPRKWPSLMEKFGYGVKPSERHWTWGAAVDMSAFTKRRKSVTVEVKVGEDDLLERLRKGPRQDAVP